MSPVRSGADRAAVRRDESEALGRDGCAVVAMLLVAASGSRWAPDSGLAGYLWRAIWPLFYTAAAARLIQARGTRWATWAMRRQSTCCVLLALAFASCLWSLAPRTSALKATSLLGTTLVGLSSGYILSPRQWMRVLQWTFAVLVLSSVALDWLHPEPVVEHVKVGWRGVTVHPNTLGAIAASAAAFFLSLLRSRGVPRAWGAAMALVSLFALAASRSRTSIAACAVMLAATVSVASSRGARGSFLGTWRRRSLGLVVAVGVLPFLLAPLAPLLGDRDPLNGRVRIWEGALAILGERPWTGYGYAVVWGRSDATLLPHVAVTAHPSAATAHNSIVHVATELGIPAAAVACSYLFAALSDAARLYEREPSAFSLFALAFAIGFTVMGFGEAHLLRIHWFFWILFVGLTVAVKRSLERPLEDAAIAHTPAA